MRSGLTELQTNILNASVKNRFFLFEVTLSGSVTPDYYWSDQAKSYGGHDYTFKIMKNGPSPIVLNMGSPESQVIPPCEVTVKISFPNSVIDGLYASNFEGASVTIRLVCGADLKIPAAPGDEDEATVSYDYQEDEIMAWRFKVLSSSSVDQVMTWECQDFFTIHLEGDYPNTPLVSDLFRADIMKSDNVCVPLAFGNPFFPIKWIPFNTTATYVDADTFTVVGDMTALFSVGQHLAASCGVDGSKSCWVSTSSHSTGVTTVNLTAGSDDLTANLTLVQTDHYLLGAFGPTYTIDRARTPTEQNGKTTYLPATYTFKQDTVTGSDAASYRAVQLICDDANKDGTNDANGFWGIIGKEIYDMPCRFSRSDLATMTSPPNIAEYIFEAWGIPSAEIDAVSQAAAVATYTARGFELAIPLWYRQPREKLISKLFSVSGMIPVIRDTVGFKVLTKVSQLIIEEDMIKPGSFSINQAGYTRTQTDSGYITWQIATEPVDQVNKSLVAAKTTTTKKSDTIIECDWIQDSTKAQKAGKLALQRSLLKDQTITFTAQAKILQLEPGDMITINPANLGAEGVAYDCLITKMTIHEGLWVDVECTKFSAALDDWVDLSASSITVTDANVDNAYTTVSQGMIDVSGNGPNAITKNVIIKDDGVLQTGLNPVTGGGLKITAQSMTGYNTSGDVRFQAIYGGDDQGDIIIGDYTAGGQGIKWDQSASKLIVKVTESGGVEVAGGGDITLTGSDADPALVKFSGSSYIVQMGLDADGNRFAIIPNTNNAVDLVIGDYDTWYSEKLFKTIKTYSIDSTAISAGPKGPGVPGNYAGIALDPVGSEYGDGLISLIAQDSAVGVKSGSCGFNAYNMFFNFYLKGLVKFSSWKADLAVDEYIDLPSFSLGMVKIVGVWDNGSPFAGDYVFGPVGGSSETLAYVGSITRSNAAGNINVYDTTSVIRVLNHSDTGHSATLIILLWYF